MLATALPIPVRPGGIGLHWCVAPRTLLALGRQHSRASLRTWRIAALVICLTLAPMRATHADERSHLSQPPSATHLYWGNTHLHTKLSLDALLEGTALDDDDAFRFARGEEVVSTTGQKVRLARPLDFLVVSDHAEALGALNAALAGDQRLLADPAISRWVDMMKAGGNGGYKALYEFVTARSQHKLPAVLNDVLIRRTVWQAHVLVTDRHNDPGRFTAFQGYEWTSAPGGNNLHRVIVFRDGADRVGRILPFSALDSEDPQDLWNFLDQYERQTGGAALTIPHNGNLSNGKMYALTDFSGNPITRHYAEQRKKWEPLMEITQLKGDGETHPFLSPTDEFSDYERWDKANLDGSVLKRPDMLQYEYYRSALKIGLQIAETVGVNPYQYGANAGSDSHSGLVAMDEDNFFGVEGPLFEPSPKRWETPLFDNGRVKILGWQFVASGYMAIWAQDNTRVSLWDAMQRKETYATTGPRMTVRFFGGWTFHASDLAARDLTKLGYARGVPMGGELHSHRTSHGPTFLYAALKDPIGANLDRIQIVKGWIDRMQRLHERVYDVAWSGSRTVDASGHLAAVGNTVDVLNATYSNDIGTPELRGLWRDPDFDPSVRAFYYARVIEIPTPRWTTYDAKRFGIDLPAEIPKITVERAYTSPIWYIPQR